MGEWMDGWMDRWKNELKEELMNKKSSTCTEGYDLFLESENSPGKPPCDGPSHGYRNRKPRYKQTINMIICLISISRQQQQLNSNDVNDYWNDDVDDNY